MTQDACGRPSAGSFPLAGRSPASGGVMFDAGLLAN
jgi:hypothetical protein